MTPKAQRTKVKIDKLDFIKFRVFCVSKDTIRNVKRPHTNREKIFANQIYCRFTIENI